MRLRVLFRLFLTLWRSTSLSIWCQIVQAAHWSRDYFSQLPQPRWVHLGGLVYWRGLQQAHFSILLPEYELKIHLHHEVEFLFSDIHSALVWTVHYEYHSISVLIIAPPVRSAGMSASYLKLVWPPRSQTWNFKFLNCTLSTLNPTATVWIALTRDSLNDLAWMDFIYRVTLAPTENGGFACVIEPQNQNA